MEPKKRGHPPSPTIALAGGNIGTKNLCAVSYARETIMHDGSNPLLLSCSPSWLDRCGREAINSFFMRNHRERVVTAAAYVALDTGDRESRAESHATLVKTALPCRGRNTWGLEFDRPGNACVRCAVVLVKMA